MNNIDFELIKQLLEFISVVFNMSIDLIPVIGKIKKEGRKRKREKNDLIPLFNTKKVYVSCEIKLYRVITGTFGANIQFFN